MLRVGAAAAAALFAVAANAQDPLEDGDPAAGERAFRICAACHAVGEDARNRVGPELNDLFGRRPGGLEGFAYSEAMEAFGEAHVWDAGTLAAFLGNPRQSVPGTKMAFAGVRKEEDLRNLLAYLAQFDPGGMAAD